MSQALQAVQNAAGISRKPLTAVEMVQAWKGQIAAAVSGTSLNAERVARVALTCLRKNPKLQECKPESVFAGILICSQMGLEIGYEAHLIPFKDECQVIFDYKGLISLNYRSSYVRDVDADVVYSKDHFVYRKGSDAKLEWTPDYDQPTRGLPKLAFAICHTSTGGFVAVVMTKQEIESIRDRSSNVRSAKKYGKQTPWDTDPDEMWKKTVMRRLSKVLPKSAQDKHLTAALALENSSDTGKQGLTLDVARDYVDGDITPMGELQAGGVDLDIQFKHLDWTPVEQAKWIKEHPGSAQEQSDWLEMLIDEKEGR